MRRTSICQIGSALESLKIPTNKIYIIHSSLLKFGIIEGGLKALMGCIWDILGSSSTILMPAFTFSYGNSRFWSYRNSKSEVGALSEYFRIQSNVSRTIHPFHSVAFVGQASELFQCNEQISSFGENSPFDVLYKTNSYNISIGCELDGGATFLHHAEEMAKVPYRVYKDFPGTVEGIDGAPLSRTFKMFVRREDDEMIWINTWQHVWDDFKRENAVAVTELAGAKLFSFNIQVAHDLFLNKLALNPEYCAIKKLKEKPHG